MHAISAVAELTVYIYHLSPHMLSVIKLKQLSNTTKYFGSTEGTRG